MKILPDNSFFQYVQQRITIIISIVVIFISYNFLQLASAGLFHYHSVLIPVLWSLFFIYLYNKEYDFLAINGYLIFLLLVIADRINFGTLSAGDILIYTLFSICLTVILSFIFQFFSSASRYKISFFICFSLVIAICVIPMMFVIYYFNFDSKVSDDILYAVFQSNSNESLEYITDYIAMQWVLLCLMIALFSGFLLFRQDKRKIKQIPVLFLIAAVTGMAFNASRVLQLPLPHFIVQCYSNYRDELNLFKKIQIQRRTDGIRFEAAKTGSGETYIIVIGESLNKKHMGLYGYFRNTTPYLSEMAKNNELLVFKNAYSTHTHTEQVLKLSLTESNLYNGKNYAKSLSIIEVLRQADVETYWLTNQVLYGAWENAVSVIATSADHLIACNSSIGKGGAPQKHDEILIPELKKILAEKTYKNRVLFLHLYGNHNSYVSRYPKEDYSIYEKILFQGDFGKKASTNNSISYYDNSVLYNDYIVSSILSELEKLKGISGFLYMADHADDVIAGRGHSIGQFTYEMTQIPMIFWFSDQYRKTYTDQYITLQQNRSKIFSNDLLYDTLIGTFSINTAKYDSRHDLSSTDYSLKAKDALLISYNRHYTEPDNYIWWQKSNAQFLIDSGQADRIFPHRVNSTGKLHDIWNDGFRSFEVDIYYGYKDKKIFQVGHNKGLMGHSLEYFLSTVPSAEIQRMWFDLKNLTGENYKPALNRLEKLNNKYNLKQKCIIESASTNSFFREFALLGWHTSYYLPTDAILQMLREDNVRNMKILADKIARQSVEQKLSAISFDTRLFSFVKEYLEPLLDSRVVYHCWMGPPLRKESFSFNLSSNVLFQDDRVKTLLVSYASQFNL